MSRFINILVILIAVAGGTYQVYFKPLLFKLGYWRVIEAIGNTNCVTVPELQACEKIVLHQPTGILYLACSTPSSRTAWTPAATRLNATGASFNDYVATYDPTSSRITRLEVKNFNSKRGLSLHGMDVVPSLSNPSELFVFLVNHRPPPAGQLAHLVGADSSIEIFSTTVGSAALNHIQTVEDPIIYSPNDVVGYPDGQGFYFTNDHASKVGLLHQLEMLKHTASSVGYCHLKEGCKYAISRMHANNGIVRAPNDTFYVTSSWGGVINTLERQSDNSLVVGDVIKTDRTIDNISIDSEGVLWAAAFPKLLVMVKHMADPSILAPSSALRISANTGPTSFYGAKYKVDKVFEDDGNVASGITSVVYDTQKELLFLHGLAAPHLSVCKLPRS